ncbi:hypothetical protein LWI29_018682 [Acer saccharum]|uniref:Uncharacterized protein n=1 Tax=Acer saccharum TaxID=4024 RepID=A0AA39RXC1_ACESA|nr:hypothetical protein LWI29_018682 [Acer saccharum]KAK1559259.1 hypothetical protein Q3G72_012521 [Acer saccharum]
MTFDQIPESTLQNWKRRRVVSGRKRQRRNYKSKPANFVIGILYNSKGSFIDSLSITQVLFSNKFIVTASATAPIFSNKLCLQGVLAGC